MTLEEYREATRKLNFAPVFAKCCGKYMGVIMVEPLEGRNTLEVDRSCIIKCDGCGARYVSQYD